MMGKFNPKYWSGAVVNTITACLGIILLLLSVLLGITGTLGVILLSVGSSVLASAIVAYITSKYLFRQDNISELMQKWGIQNIYYARAEMNPKSNQLLRKSNKLDIIAFGLKNFRESQGVFIKKRISEGMSLRILTINPDSKYLDDIDDNEQLTHGSTKKTIEQLMEWVDELKSIQKYEGQIQVKLYNALPLDFYFALDDGIFVGPYQVGKGSQQTVTYEFNNIGQGKELYIQYFEDLWEQY